MSRQLVSVVLVGLSVLGTRLSAQGPRPSPQAIAGAVDSLAARVVSLGLAPALGVAIVMDGRTVYARSHGMADVTNGVPADDRTLWYLASTSKSLTGFGIALLAHQGVLDINASIASLLPGVQWPSGVDPTRLTLAHFLSHTHYLNDNAVVSSAAFTGAIPEAQWPSLIRYATLRRDRDLVYSNFGYNVAAMVIDAKRPEGWRRFLDSAVYRPAGMTETFARVSGLDRRRFATTHELLADGRHASTPFLKNDVTMNSAGGHLSTLRDLARWVTVQMDGGIIDGRRVFPAEAVALSHRLIAPQTRDASKRFAFFDREGWAAGWDIGTYEGEPMVSRFGGYSSTRSHLGFLPRRRIGVVAMTNGPIASQATDIVAAFAYDLEAGRPAARSVADERLRALADRKPAALTQIVRGDSIRAARQRPLKHPLSAFAGSYRNEQFGTVTFEVRGDKLHYRWGAMTSEAEVFDAGNNSLRLIFADGGITATFDFPMTGGVARSVEVQGQSFTRQ